MPRKRRRPTEPLVTVEVPKSVADVLADMTADDFLHLKVQRHWLHRVLEMLQFLLVAGIIAASIYIWGPFWEWRQALYDAAMQKCTTTLSTMADASHMDWVVDSDKINQTCQELSLPLKPPPASKPWDRFQLVWTTFLQQPGEDLFGMMFIEGYQTRTVRGGTVGGVDFSGEVDEIGNPSLRAVVQEAIRLQPEFSVPWRYVVDACFYDSGGLKQYSTSGVLQQGKNPDSTDWGLCQINDKWHPDLMDIAKKDWRGNLRAGFKVMSNGWVEAKTLEGEYQLRVLWARYNGSGPYDVYAERVLSAHTLLEPRIAQILKEFETKMSYGPDLAPEIDPSGSVVISIDLMKDVPVLDGESMNVRNWALSNPTWTVKPGADWSYCDQTNSTGWSQYTKIGTVEALGICANTTVINEAVKKFGSNLQIIESLKHSDVGWTWFERVVDCPNADYVVRNVDLQKRDIVFEQKVEGDILTLRVGYAAPVTQTSPQSGDSESSSWMAFWNKCPESHTRPCGFPLPSSPTLYVKGTSELGFKGFHEGAWDFWSQSKTSTSVFSTITGDVTEVGRYANGGNNGGTTYLVISNGVCTITVYHMPLESMPALSTQIQWGSKIGDMGNEGTSDWTHLHYKTDCGSGPIVDQEQFWQPFLPIQ